MYVLLRMNIAVVVVDSNHRVSRYQNHNSSISFVINIAVVSVHMSLSLEVFI